MIHYFSDMSFSDLYRMPHLFDVVKEFTGNCYLYAGALCRCSHAEWKKESASTKTSKYLVTESRARISEALVMCARNGDDGNLLITQCMRAAARRGLKRGVVRVRLYASRKKLRLCSPRQVNMMDAAARSGNMSLIRYLEREYVPMSRMTMVEGVHAPNSVEVVRWLMDKDKGCVPKEAEEEAAKIGNLPVLRVFKFRPFSPGGFGGRVMTLSGMSGCTDTVDFVRTEGGCKLTSDVLGMAALKGHLNLIKHVRRLRVEWDDRVCWLAAYNGHLDVIKWARSDGCPWDPYWNLQVARQRKQPHVEEYCKAEMS